jgi:hypothetical protein
MTQKGGPAIKEISREDEGKRERNEGNLLENVNMKGKENRKRRNGK